MGRGMGRLFKSLCDCLRVRALGALHFDGVTSIVECTSPHFAL